MRWKERERRKKRVGQISEDKVWSSKREKTVAVERKL